MWPPSPAGFPKVQKFVLQAHKSPLRCFWLRLSRCPVAGAPGTLVVNRICPGVSRSFELGEMVQAVLSGEKASSFPSWYAGGNRVEQKVDSAKLWFGSPGFKSPEPLSWEVGPIPSSVLSLSAATSLPVLSCFLCRQTGSHFPQGRQEGAAWQGCVP